MQPSLINLIPKDLVLFSLLFAGFGFFIFRSWLNREDPFRFWHLKWAITCFVVSVVFAVISIYTAVTKQQSIQDLSQIVTPYPGAQLILSLKDNDQKSWMFETSDDPDKIHAFYNNLARQQKIPLQEISDIKFAIGEAERTVSIGVTEHGNGATIFFVYKINHK